MGEARAAWAARFGEWGWPFVLRHPRSVREAALWVMACPGGVAAEDRAVEALARHVRNGGRLLCVVRPGDREDPDADWINRLGDRLGFQVLTGTTRKPRNVAPELLGDIGEIRRETSWAAREIRLTQPGLTLISDEDQRAMAVLREVGAGRVVVVGHPALLEENADLTRNIILLLAGADDH